MEKKESQWFLSYEEKKNRIESYVNLTLFNCIFDFIGSEMLSGGAIFIQCHMTNNISKCIFTNCFSQSGGAIFISMETKALSIIRSCIFSNNYALENGGSICTFYSKTALTDCQFTNNSIIKKNKSNTEKLGGAFFTGNCTANFHNCSFKNNFVLTNKTDIDKLKTRSSGGAIYFSNSNYILHNCSFINNTLFCINSSDFNDGGAISCNYSSNATIKQSFFKNNSIFCRVNTLVNIGGGIFYASCNLSLDDCTFIENSLYVDNTNSFHFGGALNLLEVNATINYCFFVNNNAIYGASLFFTTIYSALQINNSIFKIIKDEKNITRSLIGLWISGDFLNFTFENNKVMILDSNDMYAFTFDCDTDIFNCYFSNNCIFPYNKTFLNDPKVNVIGPAGDNILEFDNIFDTYCDYLHYSPTKQFSNSNYFSSTQKFSNSIFFSQTQKFSNSNYFSQTQKFSNSNYFSQTQKFSNSNYFSSTQKFSNSNYFSQTQKFSNSNYFSQTQKFNNIFSHVSQHHSYKSLVISNTEQYSVKSKTADFSNMHYISEILVESIVKNSQSQYSMSFDSTYQATNKKEIEKKYTIIYIIVGILSLCISLIFALIRYKINMSNRMIYNINESSETSVNSLNDFGSSF